MGDDLQLTPPSFHLGWRPTPSLLGDFTLHLDPDIEAKLQALDDSITAGWLKGFWKTPNWDAVDVTRFHFSPSHRPLIRPAQPLVTPGAGPATTQAASAPDVLKALWAVPAVQDAANRAFDATLRRDWNRAGVGERVLMVTAPAVIASGAVAGIIANSEARKYVLQKLAGNDIPVPGVDGLSFRLSPTGVGVTTPVPGVRGLGVGGNLQTNDLSHPNTIRSYDVTVTFDVMPWIQGK